MPGPDARALLRRAALLLALALPGPTLAQGAPALDLPTMEVAPGAVPPSLAPAAPGSLPVDLSPRQMFLSADVVVKGVMVGLAAASFLTWTIWLAKSLELAFARRRARAGLRLILTAESLEEAARSLGGRRDAARQMLRAAEGEIARSLDATDPLGGHGGNPGLLHRLGSHLLRLEAQLGRRIARGTGLLATVGSTAPFVGLFGTVWGIMNAFIGISRAQTTNLAVVAPGIAEALMATAIGLVAAIPAVVIYNIFARSIAGYRQTLADIGAALERLVSRDLDRRRMQAARPAPRAGTAPERLRLATE